MKAVTARFRAQRRLIPALVLLVALAVALLPFGPLMAASSATAGQSVATPTATMAGHAAAGESSSHASSEGHGEQMTGADAHTETGHADAPEVESAAHGHGAEAPSAASSTRGLVLGGFGAFNGLVIVGAAISKTRIVNKVKARLVSPPDTTTGGVTQ